LLRGERHVTSGRVRAPGRSDAAAAAEACGESWLVDVRVRPAETEVARFREGSSSAPFRATDGPDGLSPAPGRDLRSDRRRAPARSTRAPDPAASAIAALPRWRDARSNCARPPDSWRE